MGRASSLRRHYDALQAGLPVTTKPEYAGLVIPNGNSQKPIHRWFHLKEGFSADLLDRILVDTGLDQRRALRVLDSFAGVGTTIVSALREAGNASDVSAFGIERNPFLHFVARTKTRAVLSREPKFSTFVEDVLKSVRRYRTRQAPLPELSTFSDSAYFSEEVLDALINIRSAIQKTDGSPLCRDLAYLCLAATVEPVSSLRRDGRALRFVPDKAPIDVLDEFSRRADEIASDLALGHGRSSVRCAVYLRDGRRPQSAVPRSFQADIALFSPPYPNNIDYTEVYKLEAWLLQFYSDQEAFREQRHRTLRSHPSVKFRNPYLVDRNGYKPDFENLVGPLIDAVPAGEQRAWRLRLIRGYFDDMLTTLRNHRDILADDGFLVYVVGNSLHGSGNQTFLIAADLMIAFLAKLTGYRVDSFVVARQPTRKLQGKPLLRESIVFLRKA
jgi:hypothetical protein